MQFTFTYRLYKLYYEKNVHTIQLQTELRDSIYSFYFFQIAQFWSFAKM